MNDLTSAHRTMRTLRFHAYGEPGDVLQFEATPIPSPGPSRVLVRVEACGLNPADWSLCRGLFAGNLPRGVGLDVAGVVDAVGGGVTDLSPGEPVFGPADYAGSASAGASDYAILSHWTRLPPGLEMAQAASLPMAVETAFRSLEWLAPKVGQTLLVNGAGSMVGFAAVQMALMRGVRVVATAGTSFAERLRALGATVTAYGEGMVERVRDIAGGAPDLILDVAPVNLTPSLGSVGSVLPDLLKIAGGDPRRILTCSDFAGAAKWGVRTGFGEPPTGPGGTALRYDVLGDFAKLAADGRFSVPIARTFPLEAWREALDISLSGRARGKLILLP